MMQLAEVRVPIIPDRLGILAEVTTLAEQLGVPIVDLEITHGAPPAVLAVVEAAHVERLRGGLIARGYQPTACDVRFAYRDPDNA